MWKIFSHSSPRDWRKKIAILTCNLFEKQRRMLLLVVSALLMMAAAPLLIASAEMLISCKSCASTLLRSQWQATALPTIPPAERFHFDDNCEKNEDVKKVLDCSSACMEMLLVAGGEYTIVRGCLADFFDGYNLPSTQSKCFYTNFAENITMFAEGKPEVIPRPFVGVRYCTEPSCNNELTADYDLASGRSAWQTKKWCGVETQQMQVYQCLSCNRFDYSGDCNWDYRQYCEGEWCTKTIGYVNGRWVENRGCAPINPSGNQLCVKLDAAHEISQLGNQDLSLPYSLEQCFCQGQRCNGAIIGVSASGALLLTALVTLFLPWLTKMTVCNL